MESRTEIRKKRRRRAAPLLGPVRLPRDPPVRARIPACRRIEWEPDAHRASKSWALLPEKWPPATAAFRFDKRQRLARRKVDPFHKRQSRLGPARAAANLRSIQPASPRDLENADVVSRSIDPPFRGHLLCDECPNLSLQASRVIADGKLRLHNLKLTPGQLRIPLQPAAHLRHAPTGSRLLVRPPAPADCEP